MPNKLSQFWQELKRRNVVRVVTVYAGAAFVIIELINNITEPLRLPEWTPTLVIVLLAIGFPVLIIFSWIYDMHPEGGIVKTEPVRRGEPKETPAKSNSWKIASYISFVVILGLIAYNIFGGKKGPGIDESLAKSIAVLPFHNYSGDPGQDYMCEGLTEEIISYLFKVRSFDEIRPFTSVLPYKDSLKSTTEIAKGLHVNYILQGTYKRMENDLKITAQLIGAKNDTPLWSDDYNIPYREIMGIPGEIALQIADHLKAFITEDEQQSISSRPTENLEAYELIQQVKSIFNTHPFDHRDSIIDLAEKAIALDPDYADPYAWIGTMIIAEGLWWGTKEMKSVAWEAQEYISKALNIDPDNFIGNFGMNCVDFFARWDYVAMMERSAQLSNQLSSDIKLNWATALFQLKMGMFQEALSSVNPQSRPDIIMFGQILLGNREYVRDRMDEVTRDMMEKGIDSYAYTDFLTTAEIYIWLQEFDRAMLIFEYVIASGKDPGRWFPKYQADLAVASFKTGRTDQARAMIGELIGRSDTTSVGSPAFFTGWYYSWIGEQDSAFYWLDKAVENRSPDVTWLKVDPAFDNLKEDPRYRDLYERTGFKTFDEYMEGKKE